MHIRLAAEDDAAEILACLRSAFEPYQATYTAAAYEDTVLSHDTLRERQKTMSVFVAETERGEIAGTIACGLASSQEGHLRGMAVRPRWHGRGIAQQLLDHAEHALVELGCSYITLDTTEPLQRAIRFYVRNGYCPTNKVT